VELRQLRYAVAVADYLNVRQASRALLWTLARIAGHSSIAISARYVHPSEDAVLDAMARLSGHNSGHSAESQHHGKNSAALLTA
jgi:hypothetical protein